MTICHRGLCRLVDRVPTHLMVELLTGVGAISEKGHRKVFPEGSNNNRRFQSFL